MIGIIGALDVEVLGIISEMDEKEETVISGIPYTKGSIMGKECVVAQCGVGKVNAAVCTQTMVLKYKPQAIINCGVAGATTHNIDVGDIVVAENVVQHDMNTSALGEELGTLMLAGEEIVRIPCDKNLSQMLFDSANKLPDTKVLIGNVATGDLFVNTKAQREKIFSRFDALACEMEGGAIGSVCYINKVPFAVLRCMSDSMDKSEGMDFFEFKDIAAKKSIAVINSMLKKM